MNIWNIPDSLENEVRARDKKCVYCGVEMLQKVPRGRARNAVATWEHIINDARIITRENIALCCCACNSSKGQRALVRDGQIAEWQVYADNEPIREQMRAASV
jgi:hypothetical protein